jgi:MarR family transcriptional regulator, temperature-dependent positive regulator of motility
MVVSDEVRYRILKLLETNPALSQREVARELGMSLGRANYCLRALIDKGWVKVANFKNSRNKSAYMYLLTPRGMERKAEVTVRFLQRKTHEYRELRAEIERIRADARRLQGR